LAKAITTCDFSLKNYIFFNLTVKFFSECLILWFFVVCACAEFVCPILGYKEFLHADWLVQILSWQKPIGCWGTMKNAGGQSAVEDDKEDEEDAGIGNNQHQQQRHAQRDADKTDEKPQQGANAGLKQPVFKTRQLLYEKVVSGNYHIILIALLCNGNFFYLS